MYTLGMSVLSAAQRFSLLRRYGQYIGGGEKFVDCREVACPLFGVSIIGGSTVMSSAAGAPFVSLKSLQVLLLPLTNYIHTVCEIIHNRLIKLDLNEYVYHR